ncbi:MAG: hypothetical protein ACJ72N_17160 [Labedaea sp.]
MDAEWTASGRLREISHPWVVDHLATLALVNGPSDGSTLNLKPVRHGPLSIGLLEFARGFHVFVGDCLPSFEMDQQDLRDQTEFEELVLAALEGRVRIEMARTPLGYRARTVLWDSSKWTFARELGASMISLGKRTVDFSPYRDNRFG